MMVDTDVNESNETNTPESESENNTPTPTTNSNPPEFAHKDFVKMQRLAKKRRVFLIQKVTKRIKLLKNKKGNEAQLSKNQRKVERLLERINDMKVLDFKAAVAELVERKFKIPNENLEQTKDWFLYELTQDKASFMSFVNSFNESKSNEVETEIKSSSGKRDIPFLNSGSKNQKLDRDEVSANKFSKIYSENDDDVLNNILKMKKNRPGQRARQKQWEEMYGVQAKHLNKRKKPATKQDTKREKKRANVELPPQEIIRKLKEKEKAKAKVKVSQKEEHPSWLAKKQQSSLSSKIDVFAGKKTTFSDDDSD